MDGDDAMSGCFREIRISRELMGRTVEVCALVTEAGISVLTAGGDRPHIGAVSTAGPDGKAVTDEFPGHRDGIISRKWAERLAGLLHSPVTVSAGIHYEGLSREGIREVLEVTDELLKALEEMLNV